MEKIKAVIVDDEQSSVDVLRIKLEKFCPEVEVIAAFTQPLEALKQIRQLNPGLIFIDVEMPLMDGLSVVEQIADLPLHVVFVTAYNHFALRAFRYNAFDYLLKPINTDELQATIKRLNLISMEKEKERMRYLLHFIKSPDGPAQYIALPLPGGPEYVVLNELIRLESANDFTKVVLKEKTYMIAEKSLRYFEETLDSTEFFRVHPAHIVNLQHISGLNHSEPLGLLMNDGIEVPVSPRKKQELLAAMNRK